ncbi:hypothetical protein COLO4_20791 [Corchorus olitorius]|uniref:Uncharacterized protein n=1 Tax=Corchorus olitorius TaxID=93759 RepID=A0A1R3IWY3_9ROSI|nr:hypothetical protein COLO4_20791 [Corchorus olitorius]
MAANTQQFGSPEDYSREGNTRRINEVSTHSTSLEQQLQETNQQVVALTDLFNANFSSVPKTYGICKQGHYTDKCPSLEHTAQEVNVVGMQGAYQRKPEPYWRAEQPSQQYGNQVIEMKKIVVRTVPQQNLSRDLSRLDCLHNLKHLFG